MLPDKVAAVADWPTPRRVSDARAFIGLAGFYRKFVNGFAELAAPLTHLAKQTVGWQWGAAAGVLHSAEGGSDGGARAAGRPAKRRLHPAHRRVRLCCWRCA